MVIGYLENKESPATDYYCTAGVFLRLAKTHPGYEIVTLNANSGWAEYAKCDVVVFSRPNGDTMFGLMRDCKQMGCKVVAVHDDLLTNVPLTNPASAHFKGRGQKINMGMLETGRPRNCNHARFKSGIRSTSPRGYGNSKWG